MEAKAGWETTSGLFYYLSVVSTGNHRNHSCNLRATDFPDMPWCTVRGEMTDALT